jgi:hypothetical protein
MNYIFWTCWVIELALAIGWLSTEMKHAPMKMNPFAIISILYLAFPILVKCSAGADKIANILVIVPAVPLLGVLFMIIIIHFSKFRGRWN